ncbi:MAG: hypothetical protein IH941_04125 [Acidobacteria bacterium]|nr:hypothetical protein [Acidobacteriota bacterium]
MSVNGTGINPYLILPGLARLGTTTVYVTHDQVEAMTLGDRVAVLRTVSAARPYNLTVTSEIVWTENPIGDEETLLQDARSGFSKTITETTTKTFSEEFSCSAEGTFTHDNTATLTGSETNLTASASVTVDCDDIQRPSLGVEQVTVATAANNGATVTGSFVIKNHSGGSITRVTLGQVTLSFISRRPGGIAVDHSATCTVTPQANGYELQPHEAKQFSYSCTITPAVPTDATELTARVTVGTATNQIGEIREKPFSATSPSFKFDGGGG